MGWVDDSYLTRLKRTQKFRMIRAFAISICRGEYFPPRYTEPLVASTFSKVMSNLATSFQNNNQTDPRTTDENTINRFVTGIIKSFKK